MKWEHVKDNQKRKIQITMSVQDVDILENYLSFIYWQNLFDLNNN